LFRWSLAKGFVTFIPANSSTLGLDPTMLLGNLPADVMESLEELDTELLTTWAPIVEEDG
jgi:hypothetical protein